MNKLVCALICLPIFSSFAMEPDGKPKVFPKLAAFKRSHRLPEDTLPDRAPVSIPANENPHRKGPVPVSKIIDLENKGGAHSPARHNSPKKTIEIVFLNDKK